MRVAVSNHTPSPSQVLRFGPGLLLGALLTSLILAHQPALEGMVARWNGSPMYSFGYIVPAVALFLLWTRREALDGVRPRGSSGAGLAVVAIAALLLLTGQGMGVQVLQQLAFLVALVAVVMVLYGVEVLKRTWVAWAYLLLMVPFWDGLTEPLHLPFQRLSASLGVRLLHAGGVPAYQEDTLLFLPALTIEVARACSGINYVIAVVALGLPLAYLYLSGVWRRVLLVLGAVGIAAASNGLRIALIALLSYWNVGSPLHGPLHVLHGLFVSGVGYGALFGGLWLLMPPPHGGPARASSARSDPAPHFARLPWNEFSVPRAVALTVLFLALSAAPWALAPTPATRAKPLSALPLQLDGWAAGGTPLVLERWWAGADDESFLRYERYSGEAVDAAIAWYGLQEQGKELVSHLMDGLRRRSSITSVPLASGESMEVNLVRGRLGTRERVGLFWYEIDGRPVASSAAAKWWTLWGVLTKRRNDGFIVVLLADRRSEVGQIEGLKDLAARLHAALEE